MTRDLKLMMASVFLWGCGEGLFIYLYPLYLEKLGANSVLIGTIMSLAAVGAAATHIPAGWLADRWGPKEMLLVGWIIGALAALAMFLAPNLLWFTVALVAYMLTAFVMSPINAVVTESRGSLSLPRALTLNVAAYAVGTLFSPALGGQAARLWGLRSVFGLAFVAYLVSTAVLMRIRPKPVSAPPQGVNRYRALLTNRRFLSLLLLSFAAYIAFEVGFPLASNFLADVRGYDPALVGLLGSFNALGIVILNVVGGRRGPRGAYILAQVLMAVSLVILLATGQLGWVALAFVFRGSLNLAHMMSAAQVEQVVDRPKLVLAYGVTESVIALAMIIGPSVAGVLYARSPALPFQVSVALLALSIPLMWWLAPHPAARPLAAALGAESDAPPAP